ncbi:MAG: hypothetical protein DRZ79_03845 [Candidatus Cloacimonadota bacterium]|nr:MAG: hypothetical protein DRZ79_03845 [Candidatus Cloacimonadota bacterium]
MKRIFMGLFSIILFLVSACINNTMNGENYSAFDKAKWYLDAIETIQTKYTKIRIAVIYHDRWENSDGSWSDLRINSSPEALQAFQTGISSSYFIGKEYLSNPLSFPDNNCFTGVFPGWGEFEDSVDTNSLENFEALSGKSAAFCPFSVFFGRNYVSDQNLQRISEYGAIPLLRFMPWGEPYWEAGYQENYSLVRIINGEFDDFLIDWAEVIAAFETPVFVTFGVEMNGNWFPWSGIFQGAGITNEFGDSLLADGPEKFKSAFRHIVNLFNEHEASNIIWYFHVNNKSFPDENWNDAVNYYPGDDYVDWIAVSVYGAQYDDEKWMIFDEEMQNIYDELTNTFPNKPLMLAEWGVKEP